MGNWFAVFRAKYEELRAWNNGDAVLSITPATTNAITAAQATAGTTYTVRVRLANAAGDLLTFGGFVLAASVSDTSSAGTAAINTTTPTLVDGEVVLTVTLPAAVWLATETVTVTIANFTAPDGRTLTGGTSVLTIAA